MRRGRQAGFSLMEVLVALALATLILGVLLSGAGMQTVRIARMEPRYRAMLAASAALEKAADQKFTGNESGEQDGLPYRLVTGSVPADPRIDQLRVEVQGGRGVSVTLRVYRLRAQHDDPAATPSPAGGTR